MIEADKVDEFKEIFDEKNWISNPEYKNEEIKRRALGYSKLNMVQSIDELKELDIYDLAMSVYLQQLHLKRGLVKKKSRKERKKDSQ